MYGTLFCEAVLVFLDLERGLFGLLLQTVNILHESRKAVGLNKGFLIVIGQVKAGRGFLADEGDAFAGRGISIDKFEQVGRGLFIEGDDLVMEGCGTRAGHDIFDAKGVCRTGKALGEAIGLEFNRLQVERTFADIVAFENQSEGIGSVCLEVTAGSIGTGLEQAMDIAAMILVQVLFLVFEEGHEFLHLRLEDLHHGVAIGERTLLAFKFLLVVLLTGFALLGDGGFILAAREEQQRSQRECQKEDFSHKSIQFCCKDTKKD